MTQKSGLIYNCDGVVLAQADKGGARTPHDRSMQGRGNLRRANIRASAGRQQPAGADCRGSGRGHVASRHASTFPVRMSYRCDFNEGGSYWAAPGEQR